MEESAMRKVLKWFGIVLGCLLGLIILAVVAVYIISGSRLSQTYEVKAEPITIPTDEASLTLGKHISETRGCTDCHGENLGGQAFFNDPAMGVLYASNLTAGKDGIASSYSDADWVLAIRHGIGQDHKALLFMPSTEYYFLGDRDLGALIAYLKTISPVDNEVPETSIGPLGRILFLAGQLPLTPAAVIDHAGPRPPASEPGVTVEYGKYLAAGCTGCHGSDYSGGPIPGAPPDTVPASNITPGGELAGWSESDFIQAMRTGVTPDGQEMDPFMPWKNISKMTDDELKALWMYLQSLPAK
jgi:mono/diheme cytochrome c family protein